MMLGWLAFHSLFWGSFGDQIHYRLSSLDPLTLDSFKTVDCGDIVYGGRVIGRVGGNWSKYEVLSGGDEILYLERGTLFHRFTSKSPAYDHPLAYDVACFTFDRLSRRPLWVDAKSARLKGGPDDGASPRILLPDCLDISASSYPDALLVLHANHTLTLNSRPILEGADELPAAIFVIPSNSSSLVMGEVGQYTVILYSISISIVLIIRFIYSSKQDRELLPLFHKHTGVYSMK